MFKPNGVNKRAILLSLWASKLIHPNQIDEREGEREKTKKRKKNKSAAKYSFELVQATEQLSNRKTAEFD